MVMHGCGGQSTRRAHLSAPYACTNDIVMLYPQSVMCWDNYEGYTGPDHLNQKGLQMQFLKRAVDIITGKKPQVQSRMYDDQDYDWSGHKLSIEESADGQVKITMWSADAIKVVVGATAAATVGITLF